MIGSNPIEAEEEWKDFESYSTNDYVRRSFGSNISALPTSGSTITTSLDIKR